MRQLQVVLFVALACLTFVGLGGCSVIGGQKAERANLEADILALGEPIVDVETRFRRDGFVRELNVFVVVDSGQVSSLLLRDVIVVLDEHEDIEYGTGVLSFVTPEFGFISAYEVGREIGLREEFIESGAFRFTRGRIKEFLKSDEMSIGN